MYILDYPEFLYYSIFDIKVNLRKKAIQIHPIRYTIVMKKYALLLSVLVVPSLTFAQTLSAQSFIAKFLTFSNNVLIPFLIGIAFLLFIINVIRFFVVQGSNDKGKEAAKSLAIYSVLAFVVILVFWGVVNLFADSIGLSGKDAPTPDYLEKRNVELKNQYNSSSGGDGGRSTPGNSAGSDPIGDIINESSDPCSSGGDFNDNGNPCGIY